jgi:hypothetical protein
MDKSENKAFEVIHKKAFSSKALKFKYLKN